MLIGVLVLNSGSVLIYVLVLSSGSVLIGVFTVLYRNGVVPELHREKGLPRRDKGVARLIMAD